MLTLQMANDSIRASNTAMVTAHIATTMIGEYQYSLVFFGFDELQRTEIIDSVDLSVYN